MEALEIPTYKVVLVGDGGVGKSTFVQRLGGGRFEGKYVATLGANVTPLRFETNHGPICLNIWDCAGQEKFGGLRDGYFTQAQGAIFMYDTTSDLTLANTKYWLADVKRVTGNLPAVLVASKCDISSNKEWSWQEFRVSSKTGSLEDLKTPILDLLRQLTGHQDLVFM